MNPNLQLHGLLLALYALLDAVKHKGLLTTQELDDALATAEANALADPQRASQLSPASLDGMLSPPLSARGKHSFQGAGDVHHDHTARRRDQTRSLGVFRRQPFVYRLREPDRAVPRLLLVLLLLAVAL